MLLSLKLKNAICVSKCRCLSVLKHLTFISPNIAELVAISNAIRSESGQTLLPHPDIGVSFEASAAELPVVLLSQFAADLLTAGG